MSVLITGADGQLGRELSRTAPGNVRAVALDRYALDIVDATAVRRALDAVRPSVVINAAAYTAVDRAESEREQAFAVNALAPGVLAQLCGDVGAKLIHVSTDFVFDGEQASPYRPEARANPLNVYGASKLDGERRVLATAGLRSLIIRTAWVYAREGRNFVLTMLRLFRERPVVNVVADQIGTPTSARSLALCLWKAAADAGPSGILHFTDAGVASWYDFAVAIHEEARQLGLIPTPVRIVPITTAQYPTVARRPGYSVLDKQETLARLDLTPVHWRVGLREIMREIGT